MHEFKKENGQVIVPLWINGTSSTSSPEIKFPVYSAEKKKNVYIAHSADKQAAIRAVEAASKAFESWQNTTGVERRNLILRAAEILEGRRDEAIAIQRDETSCAAFWANLQIDYALLLMRECAARITSVVGDIPQMASNDTLGLIIKQPIGPSLLIAPWNAALILSLRGVCSILAAGCTLVLKASELCPRTHHLIAEIMEEAKLPSGCLNIIQCRREDAASVTETLIAHPVIRKVEFIGSAAIGSVIGQLASKYLKPILMELGGKCAAIVLDDANLEDAAENCVHGAFLHHGQICFSTERILISRSISEKFIALLKEKTAKYDPGSGVTDDVVKKAHDKLVDAEKKGAKFIIGGPKYRSHSSLVPTLLTGVTREMAMFDDETFGPSAAIYIIEDDEEAIRIANDSKYGLNASIHSTDMFRAFKIARRLEVAQVHVNSMTENDEANLPIGSIKGSGWGRNNNKYGIEEFLETKVVTFNMSGAKMTFTNS